MLDSEVFRESAAVSDHVLVQRAQAGVPRAFSTLLGRHQRRIYRLAVRLSQNRPDAEEICQETFSRAFRGLGAFRGDARFATWLHRIAVNEALMRRRASARRPTESSEPAGLEWPASQAEGADDLIDAKAARERVMGALDRLDAPLRAALILRDLEELSAEDAGQLLGVSSDTVRQRAHRARVFLRKELGAMGVQGR